MGERNTVRQQPGYDGLCNYAQKITSCFGLDGKTGEEKMKKNMVAKGEGVSYIANQNREKADVWDVFCVIF